MKDFEYAAPREEADVVELLSPQWGHTEVLAGGTDLIGLMKEMVVTPERVVNITEVELFRGIQRDSAGVTIGAVTSLEEVLNSSDLDDYPAVKQAIRGIASAVLQSQGTIGGELCQRPRCWYFRDGQGLLAGRGRLVANGDNRYHAIFGNAGPAKFVSASRIAPALIALGARLRIVGPAPTDETLLPVEAFYRTPRDEGQRENVLQPNQVLTHIHLPPADGQANATYEVRQGAGPDYPLASAAASLHIELGVVRQATIVLGQVAPTPWLSAEAEQVIRGQVVNQATAQAAGEAAVSVATPLSGNAYKVQLARVAVQRAILRAAGLPTGGFE
jgi:xanthine dehydrogenase YagS FAD-binding subunit